MGRENVHKEGFPELNFGIEDAFGSKSINSTAFLVKYGRPFNNWML
jgi:hypothetical protein